jgi:hypothetical protein
MTTDAHLDCLDQLAAAATPPPWIKNNGQAGVITPRRKMLGLSNADAAFIATAREALPEMTAEVRRLRTVLAEVRDMTGDPALIQTIEAALGETAP